MKLNKLALAVAATAFAGQAMALNIANVTPDLQLQISGATAVDKQVQTYFATFCDTGTQTNYTMANGNDDATGVFCRVSSLFSSPLNVFFHKENGGSSTGVEPVSQGGTVEALNLSTCSQTLAPSGATAGEGTCSNTLVQRSAQVGISDVEPALFAISANGAKSVNAAAFNGSGASVQTVNASTFGVVVSPGLRDALQQAQGLTIGSDLVADMPSLSRSLIANIFAGNVANWSDLKGQSGVAITAGNTSNVKVNVCTRTPGSGTQAQFNAYYMGNPCVFGGASGFGFLGKDTIANSNAAPNNYAEPFGGFVPGPYGFYADGSSDMGKCLTTVSNGGRWAIGVQSLEKVDEGRTDRNEFKYVAIDGVAPTLENVASGRYSNSMSATIQWIGGTMNANQLLLAQALADTAKNIGDIAAFNVSLQQDDPTTSNDDRPGPGLFNTPEILSAPGVPANVGVMAIAGTTDPVTGALLNPSFPFSAANPVTPFDRVDGNGNTKNCAIPTIVSTTGVDVTK